MDDLSPSLSGAIKPKEELFEAWAGYPVEHEGRWRTAHICIGAFNRADAIAALMSFAKFRFGDDAYWDKYYVSVKSDWFDREDNRKYWDNSNYGFLWPYGVPKR